MPISSDVPGSPKVEGLLAKIVLDRKLRGVDLRLQKVADAWAVSAHLAHETRGRLRPLLPHSVLRPLQTLPPRLRLTSEARPA